jgi:tripeptide aminopeptidase
LSGDVASAELSYIVRDHDKNLFESRLNRLRTIEVEINQKYGAGTVSLEIKHSYENMITVIENAMYVVDIAKDAIRACGLEPVSRPVRGGTDGARLSFMGLPCPNLGAGGYAFHGPYEHVTVEGMETSVRIVKEICAHPVDKND